MTRPGDATAFEDLVEDYDAARPAYPAELYDALPALAGRQVLELGAGTGIASRELARRGARLLLSDVGPRMLARARRHLPGVPAVVAAAEALPLRDGSLDLVCGAQMWHWVDVPVAAAEASRVLRPGGHLAVWWNDVAAEDQPWWQEQQARLEAGNPRYTRAYRDNAYADQLRETGRFAAVEEWQGGWTRTVDLATYERWLRSKSYVAALADRDGFLAAERASLAAAFSDGVVVEPFRVRLVLARTPDRPARRQGELPAAAPRGRAAR